MVNARLALSDGRSRRAYTDHIVLVGLGTVGTRVLRQLTEIWSVLETLTPSEYESFRPVLGSSSGFQSAQYRAIEFLLGNKNASMLEVFRHDDAAFAELDALKPGNVHRFGDDEARMSVADFETSARVAAPALAAPRLSLGARIRRSVEATVDE